MQSSHYKSHFLQAPDGLMIHVRDYGPQDDDLPIICLSGLSRNSEDFDPLAKALAIGAAGYPRRVIAVDYRGRGLSEWDKNAENYSLPVEQADIMCVLDKLTIKKGLFIGTSRGGMHIMLMAGQTPERIHAAVINDIGPVIETEGLIRIQGYIGKLDIPASWEDAVHQLKKLFGSHFTSLSDSEWLQYAKMTFLEKDGIWSARYDPALMKNLKSQDFTKIPPLWHQYSALNNHPLFIIRGENSDLLSEATLNKMKDIHPDCETYVSRGEGHAPLLIQKKSIEYIADFIRRKSAS